MPCEKAGLPAGGSGDIVDARYQMSDTRNLPGCIFSPFILILKMVEGGWG